jgi:hypothetical protein
MKYAGGYQVKNVLQRPEVDRMAGIVTALIPRNTIETGGQNINDLAFAFITPLNSNNGEIFCH